MIRMTYECPETHEPLPSMSTAVWSASEDTAALVVFHCPECSKRHAFSRADAILAVDAPIDKHDERSSASNDRTRARGTSRHDHDHALNGRANPPHGRPRLPRQTGQRSGQLTAR